jgi:uncharacterized protein DUF6804
MLQTVTKVVKWVSIPALLMASMLSRFTGSYEALVDVIVCAGAIILALRAVRSKEYVWAAGLIPIAVVFSPVVLAVKIFFLMGLTCVAMTAATVGAFRKHPVSAK